MSASTSKVWDGHEEARARVSGARIGVLLFMASAFVSVKTLSWVAGIVIGAIMQ